MVSRKKIKSILVLSHEEMLSSLGHSLATSRQVKNGTHVFGINDSADSIVITKPCADHFYVRLYRRNKSQPSIIKSATSWADAIFIAWQIKNNVGKRTKLIYGENSEAKIDELMRNMGYEMAS